MRAEDARQHTAASVQRIDNALASTSAQDSQTKNLQSQLADLKAMLDTQTAESQTCQAAEAEASGQLQKEQGNWPKHRTVLIVSITRYRRSVVRVSEDVSRGIA